MLRRPYRRPWYKGARPETRNRAILTRFGEKEPWTDRMSDGCTLVSDPPETVRCCIAHDKAYYHAEGGAAGRRKADRAFLECMKAAGWTWRAYLRYAGVRLFGWWFWYS